MDEFHNDFEICIQPPPPGGYADRNHSNDGRSATPPTRDKNFNKNDIRFYYKFHEAEKAADAADAEEGIGDGGGAGAYGGEGGIGNDEDNACPLCSKRLCDLVSPGPKCGGDHAIGTGVCCLRGLCLEDVAAKRKKERRTARQRAANPRGDCNCR